MAVKIRIVILVGILSHSTTLLKIRIRMLGCKLSKFNSSFIINPPMPHKFPRKDKAINWEARRYYEVCRTLSITICQGCVELLFKNLQKGLTATILSRK